MTVYKGFWTKMFTWNETATSAQYWTPVFVNYLVSGVLMATVKKI